MIKYIPYIISSNYFQQFVSKLLVTYYRTVGVLIICAKGASDEDYGS